MLFPILILCNLKHIILVILGWIIHVAGSTETMTKKDVQILRQTLMTQIEYLWVDLLAYLVPSILKESGGFSVIDFAGKSFKLKIDHICKRRRRIIFWQNNKRRILIHTTRGNEISHTAALKKRAIFHRRKQQFGKCSHLHES